jgi:hypothetical protein
VRETQIVETENKMTDPPKSFVLENKIKKGKRFDKIRLDQTCQHFCSIRKLRKKKIVLVVDQPIATLWNNSV